MGTLHNTYKDAELGRFQFNRAGRDFEVIHSSLAPSVSHISDVLECDNDYASKIHNRHFFMMHADGRVAVEEGGPLPCVTEATPFTRRSISISAPGGTFADLLASPGLKIHGNVSSAILLQREASIAMGGGTSHNSRESNRHYGDCFVVLSSDRAVLLDATKVHFELPDGQIMTRGFIGHRSSTTIFAPFVDGPYRRMEPWWSLDSQGDGHYIEDYFAPVLSDHPDWLGPDGSNLYVIDGHICVDSDESRYWGWPKDIPFVRRSGATHYWIHGPKLREGLLSMAAYSDEPTESLALFDEDFDLDILYTRLDEPVDPPSDFLTLTDLSSVRDEGEVLDYDVFPELENLTLVRDVKKRIRGLRPQYSFARVAADRPFSEGVISIALADGSFEWRYDGDPVVGDTLSDITGEMEHLREMGASFNYDTAVSLIDGSNASESIKNNYRSIAQIVRDTSVRRMPGLSPRLAFEGGGWDWALTHGHADMRGLRETAGYITLLTESSISVPASASTGEG